MPVSVFVVGEKWKMVRQLFSPTVTSGKVKIMSTAMNDAVKDFVANLKQKLSATTTGDQDGVLQDCDLRE